MLSSLLEADGDKVTISGYAAGATLDLQVCVVTDNFDPKSGFRSCDGSKSTMVTPESDSIAVDYRQPEDLQIGPDEIVSCSTERCALVVADADFPSSVFAVFELTR